MNTTRAGTGSNHMAWNARVEAKPGPEAVVDRRTPTEIAADYHYSLLLQREKRERDEQAQAETAAREKRLREQAEADRKRKQAVFQMQETLVLDCIQRYGLMPAEHETVMNYF